MKRKMFSTLLALFLTVAFSIPSGAAAEGSKGMTLEDLKASLALHVEVDGLDAEDIYTVGKQYETGEGVVQWYSMALSYYQAAEKAGSADAAVAIERLNKHKAEVLENSPDGQGEVFDFYRTGVTASQGGDFEKAYAVYYDDAFFFEDPVLRGIGGLGDLLRDGTGIEQDIQKAIAIYEFHATVLGNGKGYSSLGLLYEAETGKYPGLEQSIDKAMEYFLLSYQDEKLVQTDFKGPRYAADYFDAGFYHDDGSYQEPDYLLAEEGYIIASLGNGRTFDGTACYKLGTYYEEGRGGIDQNYEKAAEYYQKAISGDKVHATMLGIPQTYLSLGRLYENGLGVEANIDTAIAYYTQAAEAAQENIDLVHAAGNEAAKAVLEEASSALNRLGK